MGQAVLRWAISFLVFALVAATGAFCLQLMMPGDPAQRILSSGTGHHPSADEIAAKRQELGLDRPFLVRLGDWLGGVWHGDFGRSWADPGEVSTLLWPRIKETMLLGGLALLFALVLALAGGIGAALLKERGFDRVLRVVATVLACTPAFVLGVVVIQFVIIRGGVGRVLADGSFRAALLPAAVLAIGAASSWLRMVRAIAIDVLRSATVRTAQARGASWLVIIRAHVLPAVFVQFLPFLGLGVGSILGATAVLEVVFSWPGVGPFAASAAIRRDLPVLQAFVFISVIAYRLSTDAARTAGWLLDPRRRSRAA